MERAHRLFADALGRCVGPESAPAVQRALLERARRHAWCADEWATVVPLLHDVDLSLVHPDGETARALVGVQEAPGGSAALAAEANAVATLDDLGRAWARDVSGIADAPYGAVLERVSRELHPAPTP